MATLEELEGEDWGEPTFDSHLVATCHRLRRKELDQFTIGDLRIMLGQGIGLRHLLHRALDELQRDPFAEGSFYPGDLLAALLREANWPALTSEAVRVKAICRRVLMALVNLNEDLLSDGRFIGGELAASLTNDIERYLNTRTD